MTRPIRVLELRSVRGTGGGPEKTILLGAQRTDKSRFAVTVCYIRDARDEVFGIDERAARLDIDYVELVERNSFDYRLWAQLRQVVRSRAIDIIHAHEYKTDFLALLLAKAEGAIPLATSHGWVGQAPRDRLLYYPVDKQLLRAFPITIAVSGEIRSELVRAGVRADRVRVVLNGIEPQAFRRDRSREQRARQDLGLSPDDVVVGAIGRLEPQKRFDLLMRACALLRGQWPTLRLVIAGDGSLRASLQTLAAAVLPPDSYRLLGHYEDIATLHHAMDVFVQSSDYEGTSNAVLEAMAFESPIVATAAGGTAEIVRHGLDGLVVPTGDVDALAGAIRQTLMERDRTAARTVRARRAIETSLSFEARMTAVENVYDELVSRRNDRARGRAGARASTAARPRPNEEPLA
jgi:glycosyltransferase involved in cell wall biosynthesis